MSITKGILSTSLLSATAEDSTPVFKGKLLSPRETKEIKFAVQKVRQLTGGGTLQDVFYFQIEETVQKPEMVIFEHNNNVQKIILFCNSTKQLAEVFASRTRLHITYGDTGILHNTQETKLQSFILKNNMLILISQEGCMAISYFKCQITNTGKEYVDTKILFEIYYEVKRQEDAKNNKPKLIIW